MTESESKTILMIEMNAHPSFVEMFDACWPTALENVILLAEDKNTENA
jgi:hypothetical protein